MAQGEHGGTQPRILSVHQSASSFLICLARMLLDFLSVLAGFTIGLAAYREIGLGEHDPRLYPYVCLGLFAGVLYVGIFRWMGLYAPGRSSLSIAEVKRLFNGYLAGAAVLAAVTFFSRIGQADPPSRLVLLYSLAVTFPLLRLERFLSRHLVARLQRSLGDSKTALILGTNGLARQLHRALARTHSPEYRLLGFVAASDGPGAVPDEGPVVATLGTLEQALREQGVEALFVADASLGRDAMLEVHRACRACGVGFAYVPDLFEFITHDVKVTEVDGIPLIVGGARGRRRLYNAGKRLFDVAASAVGLAVLSPLFLLLAILVRRDSPGPAFFSQERVGRGGRRFRIYKFRTMRGDSDPYARSPKHDPDERVTRLGLWLRRTSLDELPQLLNILKGEMSVVGPRPEMPFIVEGYTPEHRARLTVKPGLTGVWQISAHRDAEIHDVMDYDLYYVENQSFVLDMLIIVETLLYFVSGRTAR